MIWPRIRDFGLVCYALSIFIQRSISGLKTNQLVQQSWPTV